MPRGTRASASAFDNDGGLVCTECGGCREWGFISLR